uniref:Uncharacterized protein n=1 Tax=uncultured Campylobacterota bacterium TaxID=120858 RepID=Q2YZK0_9BACT|nr:hypothetical protein [uncultured Campylobacterota bacterium]
MLNINWDEYKEYKKHTNKDADNFIILLDFMKSYYNMISPVDMYDAFRYDELAKMMLDKRDITDAEGLESFLFKMNG